MKWSCPNTSPFGVGPRCREGIRPICANGWPDKLPRQGHDGEGTYEIPHLVKDGPALRRIDICGVQNLDTVNPILTSCYSEPPSFPLQYHPLFNLAACSRRASRERRY